MASQWKEHLQWVLSGCYICMTVLLLFMSRYYNNMDNKDRCEFLVISIEQQHMWNLYLLSRVETVVSGFIALSPLCYHYNDQMRIDEIIESLSQNLFSIALSSNRGVWWWFRHTTLCALAWSSQEEAIEKHRCRIPKKALLTLLFSFDWFLTLELSLVMDCI